MKLAFKIAFLTAMLLQSSCSDRKHTFDASGSFEAVETIISAEVQGTIKRLDLDEGMQLQAGQLIGYIDSVPLYLKKKQLEAQLRANGKRTPNIAAQTGYYNQQEAVTQSRLDNLLYEKRRIQNLLKADAATPKQLDDINAQIDETKKQLLVTGNQRIAQVSALQTQSSSISGDLLPLQVQIEQLNDQLSRCKIINPAPGTVLTKYAESNEMTGQGKPLYKIADLSSIILRAYVTGSQLPLIKLNQRVKVNTDDGKGGFNETSGTITWISDKAEFTPKAIQTKDERADMVYAIKVIVKNNGSYKIGMYGEINFQ